VFVIQESSPEEYIFHPGVIRMSTRVYLWGRSGCRRYVHPGGQRNMWM